MGVQGYLPKSPESVIYSNPTALGQRPLLQNLQSNDEPVVSQRSPCRSVALAVGGGLSLSAFTLNWLGRKNRRPRTIRRPTKSVASPVQGSKAKQFEALDAASCMSCLDKRKKTTLDVQYLYATPILRPGSSSFERLPALRWQEEAAAVREALEIDTELDSGSSVERDSTPLSASASSSTGTSSISRTARMQVLVATVNTLSRLAANCSASGPSWWHIAAHSEPGTGRLILEDEDGAPQVVSMSALFKCQTPPLGVSVLACEGEQAGRALLDAGASFAIVATGQLRDSTARIFASHFYRRLHCACSCLETSDSLPGGHGTDLASRVHLAFRAAKEALKTASNKTIQSDVDQLLLLEKGSVPHATPLGRSCNPWIPVAISPETPGQNKHVADIEAPKIPNADDLDAEDDPMALPELPMSICSSKSLPQDCEDFLGRGVDLQRLLQQLGAPRGRRVIILHGPCGIGKSAISAELCRFATAPGRRFAPVKGKHRLAYVSLQNSKLDSETGTEACAHLSIFAAAAGLASNGRACLLIDRAEKQFGWRDEFVPEILDKHPQLCLLITRRSPLYRLDGEGGDRWKPVNIALGPLPDVEAAQLFLQRLHRPLFPLDLWPAAKAAAEPLRPNEDLLRRIASLPQIVACGGLPRLVVRLAAEVTWELPSLLDLQPEWLKVESVSHGTGYTGYGFRPPV